MDKYSAGILPVRGTRDGRVNTGIEGNRSGPTNAGISRADEDTRPDLSVRGGRHWRGDGCCVPHRHLGKALGCEPGIGESAPRPSCLVGVRTASSAGRSEAGSPSRPQRLLHLASSWTHTNSGRHLYSVIARMAPRFVLPPCPGTLNTAAGRAHQVSGLESLAREPSHRATREAPDAIPQLLQRPSATAVRYNFFGRPIHYGSGAPHG